MPARLIESLATTGPLADLFSDDSLLQAMLDFEAALARAEARSGIVPKAAAEAIAAAAKAGNFDAASLSSETLRAGTPGIPLVNALTAKVRAANPDAARYVHWGATSQDVADTALILLLKKSQPILAADLSRLEAALRKLSDAHEHTVMLGRSLMQAAPPVTFGLKAAGWFAAIRRSRARLDAAFAESLVLQFGGSTGTLAALGTDGLAVGRAMAGELGLGFPDAPWHAHRDRLGALVAACGVLTGSLGKMARDISLLMQSEVAEAAEPGGEGRGGSSTMPHKRNPVASSLALAAANRVPGLVAAFLSGMVQEHERGVGGWQAEWPTVSAVIQATGLAAASMAEAAGGLDVNKARMREDIDATRGAIFAERAMMLLGAALGRDVAYKLLEEATRKSTAQQRRLAEVLAETPEVSKVLDSKALRDLETPEGYLGVADALRKRLLSPDAKD
ncbi:MAG TPA: 3-carboxy-cis,cis-muconate cycloisomerase [Candidatus Acidoferrales bacterium]|nr:3-carboxy-cis,cis-muconate cycloisomerase [Candidatus Acidoferrales bacterium]